MGGLGRASAQSSPRTGAEQMETKGNNSPVKRKRGRPPNVRRGSLNSKNSTATDSPRSESTKNSDSSSATEEDTCFTLRLILACNGCGESSSEQRHVVICDQCKKGYHQTCHFPKISQTYFDDPSKLWRCRACLPQGSVRKSAKNFHAITRALYKTSLPYSPSKLGWDQSHQENATHRYCYCGQDGVWKEKMLQCRKCLQWFHEKCVDTLAWPLLAGDLFYNFWCSVCTKGPEFLKRLPLSWVDVTDIVMYQLHIARPDKASFETNSEIFPYLDSIWSLLQVPRELDSCSFDERHSHVLYCLRHMGSRYRHARMGGPGGPAFMMANPKQVPALSAQHWQMINRSLRRSPTSFIQLGGSAMSISSDDDEHDDNHDVISLSSTITSSSATSIASKSHLDLLKEYMTVEGTREKNPNMRESTPPGESMRKKLRPRRESVQKQKKRRKSKKEPEVPTLEEDDDTPVVTASLAMIPIPESFDGINNPFYEEEEASQLTQTTTYSVELQPAPVKKWKVQPRDLVISKDGTVRCRRTRRRHSTKTLAQPTMPASSCIAEVAPEQTTASVPEQPHAQPTSRGKLVDFQGEKSLLRMAFPDALAYRKLLDGTTQILVRRTKVPR